MMDEILKDLVKEMSGEIRKDLKLKSLLADKDIIITMIDKCVSDRQFIINNNIDDYRQDYEYGNQKIEKKFDYIIVALSNKLENTLKEIINFLDEKST